MKTILVATDFTEASDRAMQLAVELARVHHGQLHLLHVVEPVGDPKERDPEDEEFHRELEQKARTQLESRAAAVTEVPVRCSVVLGHRPEAIHRLGQELEAWMVVMGTHAATGQPWAGTSHQVLWRADRPVLLVP